MFAFISCGASGSITNDCSHPVSILGSNAKAVDIGASSGASVSFNVSSGYSIRGVVSAVNSSCGGLAGYTVIVDVELYGTDLNPTGWVAVGRVCYTHIQPSVSVNDVLSAGSQVGTVGNYAANANGADHGHTSTWVCYGSAHPCWTGPHVHQEWKSYYYTVECDGTCPSVGAI